MSRHKIWTAAFAALVSCALLPQPASAEFATFTPPLELTEAQRAAQAAQQHEARLKGWLDDIEPELGPALANWSIALNAELRANTIFAAREALFAALRDIRAKHDPAIERLESELNIARRLLSAAQAQYTALPAQEGLYARQIKADVDRHTAQVGQLKTDLDARVAARHSELAPVQTDLDNTPAYTPPKTSVLEAKKALDYLYARKDRLETQLASIRQKARDKTLDYYARTAQLVPPYVKTLEVTHGDTVIYRATWQDKPGSTRKLGALDAAIIDQMIEMASQTLSLSQNRIAQLEKTRTALRKDTEYYRDQAQEKTRAIADTKNRALLQKTAAEVTIVLADVALTGGSVTVASYLAGEAVGTAVTAYSSKAGKQFLRETRVSESAIEAVKKLGEVIAEKELEESVGAMTDRYADLRHDAFGRKRSADYTRDATTIVNELGEELIQTGTGEIFEQLMTQLGRKEVADASSKAALQEITQISTRQAAAQVARNADTLATGGSITLAAADIATKIVIDRYANDRITYDAEGEASMRAAAISAQTAWNHVHAALMDERRRAQALETEIAALRLQRKQAVTARELVVDIDTPLSAKAISGKHVIDFAFEVSTSLQTPPRIVTDQPGIQIEGYAPDRKRRINWWQAFATLDEDQLKTVSSVTWQFALSAAFHRPYHAFDSDPATVPQIASYTDRKWHGFEPGPDMLHRLKLDMNRDQVCVLQSLDARANSPLGGGITIEEVQQQAAVQQVKLFEDSCAIWVKSTEQLSCVNTTVHKTADLVATETPSGVVFTGDYAHNGQIVPWSWCQNYLETEGRCLDEQHPDVHWPMCLDATGQLILDSDGQPYGTLYSETVVDVFYNINAPSCAGQALIECPNTKDDPGNALIFPGVVVDPEGVHLELPAIPFFNTPPGLTPELLQLPSPK